MKTKKSIIKISLISIILLLLIAMFNRSYGSVMAIAGATSLVGVLIVAIQYLILLIGMVGSAIIDGVASLSGGTGGGTIGEIVFNQCPVTTPNFFPEIFNDKIFSANSGVWNLAQTVGQYYSIIRYLAIAVLLVILIYIGIRMAMSTVASEEAKYKKMFFHWAVSLVIVFILHYIIIITLYINNVLVEALYNSMGANLNSGNPDVVKGALLDVTQGGLLNLNVLAPILGFPDVIVYVSAVVINFIFMFMYLKRIVTLGFLIIISPLITVTYSIDKLGDGKSQALNTWLKEFIFTVLIQPFHCIIYIVFVKTAFELLADNTLTDSLGREFLAIVCMTFMLQAEKIVKKIFGIQADSMGDAVGAAALTVGLMQGAFKLGKQKKEGASGRKAPDMRDNNVTDAGRRGTKNARNSNSANNANSANNSGASSNSNNSSNSNASNNASTTATATTSSNKNTSNGSTAPSSSSTAPIDNALNNASHTPKKDSQFIKGFTDYAKRMTGEKDVKDLPKGIFKSAIRGAVVGTAAIAGGTASGADGALSAGLAAYGATGNWKSNDIGKYNEKQLEINQEVLAGAYEDFAEEYRNIHGQDVSDLDILAAAKDLYENTGSGAGLDDYELDFYKKMDAMKDTYEALGYDDAWEGIEESIQLIQAKEITPHDGYIHKSYSGSSSNTQSGRPQPSQPQPSQPQPSRPQPSQSQQRQSQQRQSQQSRQQSSKTKKSQSRKTRGNNQNNNSNTGNSSAKKDNVQGIVDDLNKKKNK